MNKLKALLPILFFMLFTIVMHHPSAAQAVSPKLLLRVDDIGMNHAVNMAMKELVDTKMPLSASVMFSCPWYQEAVDILKDNPQISIGVHLTLNSEWKNYRWGPVLGREAVPSLVDSVGYFYPSTTEFLESGYALAEVEKELDAQIQRALASGLKIDYIDFHMRTALATPELTAITVKLADKYNLKRSMFMDENYVTLFDVDEEDKKAFLLETLTNGLDESKINLIIIHVAEDNPEMKALLDMNNAEQNTASVAKHRKAELEMLTSDEVQKYIKDKEIRLVNYGDL